MVNRKKEKRGEKRRKEEKRGEKRRKEERGRARGKLFLCERGRAGAGAERERGGSRDASEQEGEREKI
jgi:hypothetical protein